MSASDTKTANHDPSLLHFIVERKRTWIEQVHAENTAMKRHAMGRGLEIPEAVFDLIDKRVENLSEQESIKLHNTLSKLVAPAEPQAITIFQNIGNAQKLFFGDLRLIVWMTVLLLGSIIGVVGFASYDKVSPESLESGILYLTGTQQWLVIGFVFCAASLGAAFANLIKIFEYVAALTYQKRYEMTYWVRYFLGVSAGFILAEFSPVYLGGEFTKPVIAMLGGFGSRVVEEILKRALETIKVLVNGSLENKVKAQQILAKAELGRIRFASKVQALRQLIEARADLESQGASKEQLASLDKRIKEIEDSLEDPDG